MVYLFVEHNNRHEFHTLHTAFRRIKTDYSWVGWVGLFGFGWIGLDWIGLDWIDRVNTMMVFHLCKTTTVVEREVKRGCSHFSCRESLSE